MLVVSLILLGVIRETVSDFRDYHVKITNNGPVILGATITFRAEVYKHDVKQEGIYQFEWRDSMEPQNKYEEQKQGVSIWKINHSPSQYKNGTYEVQVTVYPKDFWWTLCYGTEFFTLEGHLVGGLRLQQKNTDVQKYVSTDFSLRHIITLHGSDNEYLKSNATSYDIEWWIDGNRTAVFSNLNGAIWDHQFKKADGSHTITAVILAVRKKPTSLETSTEVNLVNSTNSPDLKLNNATNASLIESSSNSTSNVSGPACNVKTQVCGSFSRFITVKAPIKNVNVVGNTWLQHGDMLSLRLTCNGSGPFMFCYRFFVGPHTVLGNETCRYTPMPGADCDFPVNHYFRNSTQYTVLLIIENDVSKNISAYGVNIYEVTKHPQLSVIVVPLTASILALILIIFGVAFYFQNRSSYAIEVADFDFTNNNDLEYKTFKERLAEAIHNAFTKPEDFSEEDSYNEAPSTSNKKYGSMQ